MCMHIVCVVHVDTYNIMHDVLVWCYANLLLLFLQSYLLTAKNVEESRGIVDGSEASGTETNKEKGMSHARTCMYRQFVPSSLAYCV